MFTSLEQRQKNSLQIELQADTDVVKNKKSGGISHSAALFSEFFDVFFYKGDQVVL